MKKVLVLLSAFVFLWGCEKVGADEPVVKDDDTIKESVSDKDVTDSLLIDFELPAILYASVSGDDEQNEDTHQTRTYVGIDRKKVLWHNGDAVSYFAGNIHNARYAYTGEDGQSSVELAVDPEKSGNTGIALLNSQAVYPYDENVVVKYEDNMDKIELTYPTTQKYGVNSFGKEANIMVAAGKHNSDDNLYFRNACGYLIIKLYGQGTNEQPTTIKSITLSSVSGVDKIAGKAVIVAKHDAAPVITMADDASTAVTLDCNIDGVGVALGADAEHATEFWFCLPPVTFTDGIKITVTDVYGNVYTKQTSKTVNIGRNTIQPMAAIEFVSNAPAATKLWYTRSDNSTIPLEFYDEKTNPFDAQISRHYYDTDLGKIVIEFSSPLTTIKEEAFRETIIASITLPEGVTTIEEGAFESSDLTEITVPGSMMNIGINAFWDCTDLSSVTFLPSATRAPLKIGCMKSGTTEWGPFYDSPLSTVNLNRELVSVWGDGEVFAATAWDEGIFANKHYESVASASVIIGSQVETLPDYMFYGFPIQTLTIPGTLKTIGNCVFDECKKLTSLIYEPSPTGTTLTHGFNDDTDDDGPFYASPLTSVHLNREINYTYSSSAANAWEGLFGKDSDAHALTDIIIGEQVKTLSPYMFAHAPITSFVIPATVTSIERNVFDDCKSLTSLTFEKSSTPLQLKSQGDSYGPFYDSPLATIVCNRPIDYRKIDGSEFNPTSDVLGVFAISSDVKSQISDGTDLTIGQAVTTIYNHMFYNLPIKTITIPGSVNTIGNNVFNGCNSLTEITFEPSPTGESLTIGYETSGESENLFQDYCKLTTLNLNRELIYTFGDSYIDSNSEGLFGEIPTLTSVTLGDQVKTLHKYMFANSRITELTIPGSVTTIANDVFHDCIALASLTFSPSPTGENLTIGYDTYGEVENLFQDYCPLTTLNLDRELNYTLADSYIDTNSEGVFGGISTLTNVTLGDQVKTLHKFMFAGTGIKSINLNKVATIGNYAFYNNAALESVNLGNVTTIAKGAFEGVSKVTTLDIPATVTSIGDFAFKNWSSLATLNFLSGSSDLTIGFQPGSPDRGPFYQSPLTTIAVNRSLVLTETYASACDASDEGIFSTQHGSQSTTISLGGQVGKIPEFMFASLPLESITIPATVTEIGNDAFSACNKLSSITFAASAEPLTIGYNTIGDHDGPFIDSPLTTVVMDREIQYTFPTGDLDSPYEGLFGNKTTLTSVTLGDNVKTLSPYMFANSAITSLDLNKVTTIGKSAFEGVSKVTTLDIPATVTSIGDFAFKNWSSLATLKFLSGSSDLTIGFQPGSDDRGPFYQSPLQSIKLDRQIAMTADYNTYCDQWDEGIFSNSSYNADGDWVTDLVLGPNVKTILKYMFAGTRVQQLHIPETVENIGVNVIENNKKLNAIIFYDEIERPNVEYGAFGVNEETLGVITGPPGNGQYYVFVPYRLGRLGSYRGELYYTTEDLMYKTYWDVLHAIMVDDQPKDDDYQPHRNTESWYLDVTGYEWYRKRYYNKETITPPTM